MNFSLDILVNSWFSCTLKYLFLREKIRDNLYFRSWAAEGKSPLADLRVSRLVNFCLERGRSIKALRRGDSASITGKSILSASFATYPEFINIPISPRMPPGKTSSRTDVSSLWNKGSYSARNLVHLASFLSEMTPFMNWLFSFLSTPQLIRHSAVADGLSCEKFPNSSGQKQCSL